MATLFDGYSNTRETPRVRKGAAALGKTLPPNEDQISTARIEGWVALPVGSLSSLNE